VVAADGRVSELVLAGGELVAAGDDVRLLARAEPAE
jgi:hypothetical protein